MVTELIDPLEHEVHRLGCQRGCRSTTVTS
jgi:hypothetical protein